MKITQKIKTMDKRMSELEGSLRAASQVMDEYEKDKISKEKEIRLRRMRERILTGLLLASNIFWLVLLYVILQKN